MTTINYKKRKVWRGDNWLAILIPTLCWSILLQDYQGWHIHFSEDGDKMYRIPHFNIVFICAWSIFASFVIASTVFDWSNYNIVNLVVMILSQPCPMKLSDLIVCPTLNYLWFVITKRPHSPPDCRCSNLVMEANWK